MNNNQFKFRTQYDDFLQKQDASKANIAQPKARSAVAVDPSATGNKWYDARLGKQQDWDAINKKYDSLRGDYNKTDTNIDKTIKNWGENYGSSASGNIFADDWKWKEGSDLDLYAGDYWEQGRGLAKQYTQEQQKINRQYDDLVNSADREQQRASISKAHSLRNAQQTNSVLGRGGQGADESMRRNLDMNYNNTLNSINTNVNRDVQKMYNDWLDRVEGYSESHRKIETGAKNNYNTALHKDMISDTDSWLRSENESGLNPNFAEYAYNDINGNAMSYNALSTDTEKKYLDDLAKRERDYKYFLNSQRDKELYEQYKADVKRYGSENEEYKKHQADNVLKEQKAAQEAERDKAAKLRGAVANVSNSIHSEVAVLGGTDNYATIDGKKYTIDMPNSIRSIDYRNQLKKNAADKTNGKLEGDIIEHESSSYVLYKGKWRKLLGKK